MRLSSDVRRLFLSVAGGLAFALALLFGAGAFSPDEARALDPATKPQPRYFNPVTVDEAKAFRRIIEASYGPDEAKKTTARKILNRQALRTIPRFTPAAVGAGAGAGAAIGAPVALGALAAGAWTVVGLELYYLPCWECSPIKSTMSPELRYAEGAIAGAVEVNHTSNTPGNARGQAIVTYMEASRQADGTKATVVAYGYRNAIEIESYYGFQYNHWADFPALSIYNYSAQAWNSAEYWKGPDLVKPPPYKKSGTARVSDVTDNRALTVVTPEGNKQLCAANGGACNTKVTPPTLETGSWDGAAQGTPFRATPQESNDFINSVVADTAAPEVVPEEDMPPAPEPDPDWDPNTDPFSPLFDPFADPEGDPDGDRIPNREDDDPEGDGDPDEDGDPNEHPRPIPYAPTDDPEGDGDTDGDGDPDETNPYSPQPDPYDPQTNPDGDPDGDGIPNKDDPGPATPTSPEELPEDHPYADPDTDGQPNREDPDDDGDGIPDEDDPLPFVPTDPGELPDDHPYADPDVDGEPNKDDQDDDGDGAPDTTDPSPSNPSEPGTDPDGDGDPNQSDPDDDNDGVPDTEDPAPYDPSKPEDAPQGDPDGDGQPNDQDQDDDNDGTPDADDPAPYDPTQPGDGTDPGPDRDADGTPDSTDPEPDNPQVPEGGPDGDPDADGSPNKWDPAPSDGSNPQGGPQGDPDGDGVPNTQDPAPNDPSNPGDQTGGTCPAPRQASFDLPELDVGTIFPFSLVVWGWEAMAQLAAPPTAPRFEMGFLGVVDFSQSPAAQSFASLARTCIWLVGGVGMAFVFYTWIRSGSS